MKRSTDAMSEHSAFSQISSAIDHAFGGRLTEASAAFFGLASLAYAIGAGDDTGSSSIAYATAGGLAGTACALLWHPRGGAKSVVVGRAIFAFASGIIVPRVLIHWFPWVEDLTRDGLCLAGAGMLCALGGFVLGHGCFVLLQRLEDRVSKYIGGKIGLDVGSGIREKDSQ